VVLKGGWSGRREDKKTVRFFFASFSGRGNMRTQFREVNVSQRWCRGRVAAQTDTNTLPDAILKA
jgi:hypothetical protein